MIYGNPDKEIEQLLKDTLPAFSSLYNQLKDKGLYFVFYTHRWTQGKGTNALILPNDKRFDAVEFAGLVIDMVMDYYSKTDQNPVGDIRLKSLINVLTKVYDGRIKIK